MTDSKQHPASYRDPAGFIFEYEGKFYRQVNQCYAENYQLFKTSGLYDALIREKKILAHTELNVNLTQSETHYKTLLPEQLSFISYPYEWCFGQWKDAALLTLELVRKSIDKGMILKDATPFNIQFTGSGPVFIDTLSFEKYDESKPWVAYRQFTECFIAPLLLAKYQSPELLKIFQVYPAGIPLAVLARMLPVKSRFNWNVLLHIFLPASISGTKRPAVKKETAFSKQKLQNIIQSLDGFVRSLQLPATVTTWNNYYETTVLSNDYVEEKKKIIKKWIGQTPAHTVLDIGANTGLFAEIAAAEGKFTLAVDADIACIDKLYTNCRSQKMANLLPLYIDIVNPSPAIGWDNEERAAFLTRTNAGITMALAVIHHLAIGNHISFEQMAATFSNLSPYLIIEFIPKDDPKVSLLLEKREDIFTNYSKESFETAFLRHFSIIQEIPVPHSVRVLYLLEKLTVPVN